jgi:hypothetical protein
VLESPGKPHNSILADFIHTQIVEVELSSLCVFDAGGFGRMEQEDVAIYGGDDAELAGDVGRR